MGEIIEIRVSPDERDDLAYHRKLVLEKLGQSYSDRLKIRLVKRSLDARRGRIRFILRYEIGEADSLTGFSLRLRDVSAGAPVIIVGAGPAGMFAALRLIELGFKPVIVERGKTVRERRFDLAAITKRGEVNAESNYCFGEGGAGTFSDGKLYTRSNKRGSIERVLGIFIQHGASPDISVDAHPHIGTNKLPKIVQAIRESIVSSGGEIHFNTRVDELVIESGRVCGVQTSSVGTLRGVAVILATGHSARDVFRMLQRAKVPIESKSFALGVRVEHPQALIDEINYGCSKRHANLPAASYSLVAQCQGRGVFSFCMCPGGIICPAATANDEIVVNGWSPSTRGSRFANSGVVVEVRPEDLAPFSASGELAGVELQHSIEATAFAYGGGKQVAPAQRLMDFLADKTSTDLPESSYIPGLRSCSLGEIFPSAFTDRLIEGFREFNRRRRGYLTNEAIVVAVESRTSSPIRVPRDSQTLMSVEGLFPCGEGAGYAGGIVSAAMDGERVAEAVSEWRSAR